MAKVTGYVTLDGDSHRDVIVTTEHPLSSYGQPVIIDGDREVPAQNFGARIHRYRSDTEEQYEMAGSLIDAANKLSGHYSPVLDERGCFDHWFADSKMYAGYGGERPKVGDKVTTAGVAGGATGVVISLATAYDPPMIAYPHLGQIITFSREGGVTLVSRGTTADAAEALSATADKMRSRDR